MCRRVNSNFSFILLLIIAIIGGDANVEYNSRNSLSDKHIQYKLLLQSRTSMKNYVVSNNDSSKVNEDDKCRRDLDLVFKAFTNQELWALKRHLWYLAADMQLFLISPIILYPLYKKPKVGLMIIAALFLFYFVCIATIVGITKHHTFSIALRPDSTMKSNVFTNIGYTPYNRAGAWLVGILFGYDVTTKRREHNLLAMRLGWFFTVGSFSFCIFGIRSFMETDYKYNVIWEICFAALSRPLWAFGVCWIIYASIYNYAGPISSILCWKLFVPLSKISYCVYLVHMLIQVLNAGAMRTLNYFSDYFVWHDYLSDLIICIIVGFCFSLLFETPVMV